MKLSIWTIISVWMIMGCHRAEKSYIMTVNGKIPSEETGVSLIHEHILVDWAGADSTGYDRWNKDKVVLRALPFIQELYSHHVQTFFDCTPSYLGRDPNILKMLADSTGINFVTNTGYYGAVNNKFLPDHAFSETAEQLADRWTKEYESGIEDTKIKPGFIKISVSSDSILSDIHTKLITAAAITHKNTGLPIVSHTGPDAPAFAQLEVLKKEGVSPSAFIWTHAQRGTFQGYLKAAQEGAWISIDNVSPDSSRINWYVRILSKARESGLLNQILISQDSGWYNVGQPNGGDFKGYTAIFEHLLPLLRENGFSERDIEQVLVKNPAKAYGIKKQLLN